MIQTSSRICIATRMGAIGILADTNYDLSSNGQKIQIFTQDVCCFKDGLLTIVTNNSFLNKLDTNYYCEVL